MFFKKKHPYRKDDLDSVIGACLQENREAQRILVKMFFGFAKSVCMRYSANNEETEEIINDGFLKVFNNLSKYDQSLPFKAWLRTIMVNTAIDHYRKNEKYQHHVSLDDMEIAETGGDIISKITAEEILALIRRLPPAYRTVFTLHVIDNYTHREIADMLGIKEGTSKSNLQDARRKLQLMIKNTYPHLYLSYGLKLTKLNEN